MPAAEPHLADNLRHLMAEQGLTASSLAERSGLSARTIKALLATSPAQPHARTLHQLAHGLGVSIDALRQNPFARQARVLDRATNPAVDEAIASHPEQFVDWTAADFDELYSRFGHGGPLTFTGALDVAQSINRRRAVLEKAVVLLDSAEAELLASLVDLLYARVVFQPPAAAKPASAAIAPTALPDTPAS